MAVVVCTSCRKKLRPNLAEVLARLERLAVSHKPEVVKAVANDAATARRESQLLLSYASTSEWSIGYLRNLVDFLALGL